MQAQQVLGGWGGSNCAQEQEGAIWIFLGNVPMTKKEWNKVYSYKYSTSLYEQNNVCEGRHSNVIFVLRIQKLNRESDIFFIWKNINEIINTEIV